MSAQAAEEALDGPATPSPAFQAHLQRFRCSPSPTSTRACTVPSRAQSRTPVAVKAEDGSNVSLETASPTRSAKKRSRARSISTPPRADGSSVHFPLKAEAGAETDAGEVKDDAPATPAKKKKKRPTRPYADPSQYAHLGDDPLPDYIEDGLAVLLCGINPGVKSAQLGLHYANPTNHYWKCLAESGMTPRLLHPSEGPLLPSFGIGATNLVERPTAEMSEISNQEMAARVPGLLRKVVFCRPRILAFVGMKICEIVMRYLHNLHNPASSASASPTRRKAMPKVKIGLQPVVISLGEGQDRIYVWCLPSTSARVVEYQLVDKIKIWKLLRADMDRLAQSPPIALELPKGTVEYTADSLFPPVPDALPYTVTLVKAEELGVVAVETAGSGA
ncbi:hypothetical protein JCM3770_001941 [Rhodotorula araucariae]